MISDDAQSSMHNAMNGMPQAGYKLAVLCGSIVDRNLKVCKPHPQHACEPHLSVGPVKVTSSRSSVFLAGFLGSTVCSGGTARTGGGVYIHMQTLPGCHMPNLPSHFMLPRPGRCVVHAPMNPCTQFSCAILACTACPHAHLVQVLQALQPPDLGLLNVQHLNCMKIGKEYSKQHIYTRAFDFDIPSDVHVAADRQVLAAPCSKAEHA